MCSRSKKRNPSHRWASLVRRDGEIAVAPHAEGVHRSRLIVADAGPYFSAKYRDVVDENEGTLCCEC